jgi:hypothetical protein
MRGALKKQKENISKIIRNKINKKIICVSKIFIVVYISNANINYKINS